MPCHKYWGEGMIADSTNPERLKEVPGERDGRQISNQLRNGKGGGGGFDMMSCQQHGRRTAWLGWAAFIIFPGPSGTCRRGGAARLHQRSSDDDHPFWRPCGCTVAGGPAPADRPGVALRENQRER